MTNAASTPRPAAAVAAILAALALITVAPVKATASIRANTLIATVGPGFTITMNEKSVKAGTYTIVVRDKSSLHNFHLTGPGVNKLTGIPWIGTTTWTVKLKKGTYRYVCDPHLAIMHGSLQVT